MLEIVRGVNRSRLLLGELGEDLVLGRDRILLAHRCKVPIVRLGFLETSAGRSALRNDYPTTKRRTSVLSRWTFSSRFSRLNTLRLFCSSKVLQAVESWSISP